MERLIKPVVGYARVSKDEPGSVSIAAQHERIKAFCSARDWTLVEIHTDDGWSGKSLKRPGIEKALGTSWPIVAVKLDRVTRSLADWVRLLQDRHEFVLIEDNFDMTTAMGRAMASMRVVFAELERGLIGERTKAALAHLKSQGKRVSGRIPYGYRLVEGNGLEPDPYEQEQLGVIKRFNGTPTEISNYLNGSRRFARGEKLWRASTIAGILKRNGGTK